MMINIMQYSEYVQEKFVQSLPRFPGRQNSDIAHLIMMMIDDDELDDDCMRGMMIMMMRMTIGVVMMGMVMSKMMIGMVHNHRYMLHK